VGVFSDTTKTRRAVETIELLSSAVEEIDDSVLIADHAGVIQYVNPAFEVRTGNTRDEAMGQTPRILKSGQHGTECYREASCGVGSTNATDWPII
jgi:two-component system, cell cycle sensor histidine kinase and response regulator CckA